MWDLEVDLRNRRAGDRVSQQLKVRYSSIEGAEAQGLTLDVSPSGARILFYAPPAATGDWVSLEIAGVELYAQPVWAQSWDGRSSYVAGVQFAELEAEQRARLSHLFFN
jgi:hypothetical protein